MSHLFDVGDGTVLLTDVQAHSVRDGSIGGSTGLVEGGQLLLLWESDCRAAVHWGSAFEPTPLYAVAGVLAF